MDNNAFSNNFLNLNLLSFFNSNNTHNDNNNQPINMSYEKVGKNNNNCEDELIFKNTPIPIEKLNEEFLEKVGITVNGTLNVYNPCISGGTYRMRRKKRKVDESILMMLLTVLVHV